jgi:hypothetical protein
MARCSRQRSAFDATTLCIRTAPTREATAPGCEASAANRELGAATCEAGAPSCIVIALRCAAGASRCPRAPDGGVRAEMTVRAFCGTRGHSGDSCNGVGVETPTLVPARPSRARAEALPRHQRPEFHIALRGWCVRKAARLSPQLAACSGRRPHLFVLA